MSTQTSHRLRTGVAPQRSVLSFYNSALRPSDPSDGRIRPLKGSLSGLLSGLRAAFKWLGQKGGAGIIDIRNYGDAITETPIGYDTCSCRVNDINMDIAIDVNVNNNGVNANGGFTSLPVVSV